MSSTAAPTPHHDLMNTPTPNYVLLAARLMARHWPDFNPEEHPELIKALAVLFQSLDT